MTTVIQSKFDGGHAEDIRTTNTNECEYSYNFDIFTNPHKLIPYGDSVAETTATDTMADIGISDIDYNLISSSYLLRGIGNETSSSASPTFWSKSAITGAITWASDAVGTGGAFQKGSGVIFNDKFFALAYSAGTYTLNRYNGAGSVTSIGTITSSSTFLAKSIVHPSDKKLYGVIGVAIFQWDGSTLNKTGSGISLTLPTTHECTSLTDWGDYLAITMRPLRGNGNSVTYLWDRQLTLVDANSIIDWGEGNLVITENLNNTLITVMLPQNTNSTAITNKIKVKGWSGGAVETLKSLTILNTQSCVGKAKAKNEGKLYFGLNNDYATYVFGKNKSGNWILTQDRFYNNGTIIGSSLYALQIIGDVLWRGFSTAGSAYVLMRSLLNSGESVAYSSTSIYKTTINPSMPIVDRTKKKKLRYFKIFYTGTTSGTVGVKYLVDGLSSSGSTTMESIISQATTVAKEDWREATMLADNQAFAEGIEYQFQLESTGGVVIKGYEYAYDIVN